ncbi:MAG TPA: HAD-IIB family hydrolase [Sphingomonas sp.]|nr:HAD-IIB family hydrolase [Sphingomonas sp.]
MKRLVAFDLDGTLAESKQAIDGEMAERLAALTRVADVCVISGGDWPQFKAQVVDRLPESADRDRLFIMPTSGAKLYRHRNDEWRCAYAENFSDEERERVLAALDKAVKAVGLDKERQWGERIEDRGSQITLSALGQQAPLDAKKAFDPDRRKREAMQQAASAELPDLSVNIGGSTSIDITRKGVDKAYGVGKLAEASGVARAEMIFVGDAIYPGGNDYPVRDKAGVDCIAVNSVDETKLAIEAMVLCLRR